MLGTILIFSKRPRIAAALLPVALVLGACGSDAADSPDLTIIATTSIAGDLVSDVVGDDATVEVLMPIGTDPHDFQPSSQQAAALRGADLVVAWGLGLEEGMDDVLGAAAEEGVRILGLSALVDPIPFQDDHDHGGLDPHTWMDPVRMAQAAREIGTALAEIAPDVDWAVEAERAAGEMMAVHEEVESILASIPADRRKLVTSHESLGYLAARYDFEIVGVAIPGGSTLAAPSSAQIAALVDAIRDAGVPVLFAEASSSPSLLEAVADEVEGVRVVEILEGSLAEPGEPGDTLAGMLVHNAGVIAEALS
jgi:zinc/manganese transport system substrate-binding protein